MLYASGIKPSQSQINALETAACRLLDSLPGAYADSFKVVDFGFYLHNENTNGGYPEVFHKVIDEVGAEASSKYYLIFGKQTDKMGICTKIWVALNLPNQDIFYCIDQLSPNLRNDLTDKYGIIANSIHDTNEKDYHPLAHRLPEMLSPKAPSRRLCRQKRREKIPPPLQVFPPYPSATDCSKSLF